MGRSVSDIQPEGALQEELFELLDPRRLYDWHTRSADAVRLLMAASEGELAGGQRLAGRLLRGWAQVMLPEWGIYCTLARLDPETGKPVHHFVGLTRDELAAVRKARRRFGKQCQLYHTAVAHSGFRDPDGRFGRRAEGAITESVVLVREPRAKRDRIHTYLVSLHREGELVRRARRVEAKVPELRLNLKNIYRELNSNPLLRCKRFKGSVTVLQRPYDRWMTQVSSSGRGELRCLRPGWSFPLKSWRELMASMVGQHRTCRGMQKGRFCFYPWLPLRYGWG